MRLAERPGSKVLQLLRRGDPCAGFLSESQYGLKRTGTVLLTHQPLLGRALASRPVQSVRCSHAMFRAILFDLWETLINDKPERAQPRRLWRIGAVRDVLVRHDCDIAIEAIEAALDASSGVLARLHDEGKDLGEGGRALMFVEQLREQSGIAAPEAATQDLEEVITSMPLDISPMLAPFAVETLAGIKQRGLATGLVCNTGFTTTPHLLPMLAHYSLSDHLDVMVFSDQMRVAKPDPRIFAKAVDGIGLPVSECAFVGDNPHTDIAGAQAVGMFAVQIGGKQRDGVTPDARIDDLSQLLSRPGGGRRFVGFSCGRLPRFLHSSVTPNTGVCVTQGYLSQRLEMRRSLNARDEPC